MNDTLGIEDYNQTLKNIKITQNTFVNTVTVATGLVVVTWTILTNSVISLCFLINRKKIWPSFSTQILSLSVSDMCVGYASLPFAIFAITGVNFSYRVCSLLFFLFFSSQCASLYQIFGICVHRCVVIHKSARTFETRSDIQVPLLLVVSAWVFSIVVCSLPLIIYGEPDVEIKFCVIHEIFRENLRKATGLLFIIYFVPQVLTNVLYIVACIRLRCVWKKVFPDQTVQFESTTGTVPHAMVPVSNEVNITSNRPYNRTSVRTQRKVMGTVGVLMIIFNICTVPLILLLKLESVEQETKRNLRFIASALFILNSALNPFVYALRTDWLKLALKKMFNDFFETICLCKRV